MSAPAFPSQPFSQNGLPCNVLQEGMTLRDYFAAKAMQTILKDAHKHDWKDHKVAEFSYEMADAMIEARKEQS